MNLLVTGAFAWTEEELNTLRRLGHDVVFMQQERDKLPCKKTWIEGVVCNGFFLYHDINQFERLKYIQLTSAGYDRVPMPYIKEHKIAIYNAKGVYSIPMAEFALAGVLTLYKQIHYFIEKQEKSCWEKHRGLTEMYGKTVCIVGCGSVGTECAKRFKAFGCKVIGIDVMPYSCSDYDTILSLGELVRVAKITDILVLTMPLNDSTYHLIDGEVLKVLPCNAVLVNIARGGVVDTDAMIFAIKNKKIGGAVLDVFEEEPLNTNSPLWNMENVLVTPHNSFVGQGNHQRMFDVILNNILEYTKFQEEYLS